MFFKKNGTGSLINNLMEKNSHEHYYNINKVHKQIAQLRVKPVEPHRDQMLRL